MATLFTRLTHLSVNDTFKRPVPTDVTELKSNQTRESCLQRLNHKRRDQQLKYQETIRLKPKLQKQA